MVTQWLVLLLHSKKLLNSDRALGPFCVQFACSLCVLVFSRYSAFLALSKGMLVGFIGDSKVALGSCLSLC